MSDLHIGVLVATLPGVWYCRVSARTGWSGVTSMIRPGFCLLVGWLLNVPATGYYISGTDLLRQFFVLPH